MKKINLTPIACAIGLALAQAAQAATLDLTFNYRLTPADAATETIATAHFEDVMQSNGDPAVDLTLTNVASNKLPGVGTISYISGLLLTFNYLPVELPNILVEDYSDDTAQKERWEPQEDVATVDGFTFTSELGFPRSETPSTKGWRLGVGETGHVRFYKDPDGSLPSPITVTKLIEAVRGSSAAAGAPKVMAAVKVRSILNLTGGEEIESVPTIVIGAAAPKVNHAPVANAGNDANAQYNELVVLDGSTSTDSDNDSLTYEWAQISGTPVTLSNANQAKPSFTVPSSTGQLVFSLKVSDGKLQSSADTVVVNVSRNNAAPKVDAGVDIAVTESSPVVLTSASSDPDGDGLTYQWQQTSGVSVSLAGTNTANLSFTAPVLTGALAQSLEFKLTVTDNFNPSVSASDSIKVQINPAAVVDVNKAPVANAGLDAVVRSGTTVTLNGSAADLNNDSITAYEWVQTQGPAVVLSNANTANANFTAPLGAASLVFSLKASDGKLQGAADTVTVSVDPKNVAPTVNAGSDQSVNEASKVTLQGAATDADGDAIGYQWRQISGSPVTLSASNQASVTFTAPWIAKDPETLEFELTATDSFKPALAASDTVKVIINNDGSLMDCSQAKPDRASLWPANAGFVNVKVLGLSSPKLTGKNPLYDLQIDSITQDEPLKNPALKDKTSPDAKVTKTKRTAKKPLAKDVLFLRSERQGVQPKGKPFTGNGRVYQIAFTANDGAQSCKGNFSVQVPGTRTGIAIDDGQLYDAKSK